MLRLIDRVARQRPAIAQGLLVVALIVPTQGFAAASCEARSGATRVNVVELYTSEGCSSCPPADRWFSTLASDTQGANPVLPLAFHVTYWDRLGWADRFARPAYTERQYSVAASIGAAVVYTPQVIVNGVDWRSWPRLPRATAAPDVEVQLSRDGDTFTARIKRHDGSSITQPISGYWAMLEDGHQTQVRAGENSGATLRHDHVVSAYQPVGTWPAASEQQWQWRPQQSKPESTSGSANARQVAFVVVDAKTQKPLQAVALGC
ncbi:MAG: DUF1223 domain-containing protein [Ideonella sp.]